jgi:hypothetical protein
MFQRSIAATLAGVLCLTPGLVQAATPLGADTPQALVARMNKAADTKDFSEITACLDRASRVEMSAMMMLGAVMMVGFMGMGSDMAEGMAGAMGDQSAESKKKAATAKAEVAAKTAKAKAALSSTFKKHGLPDLMDEKALDAAGDPKEALAKIDHPVFVRDMMAVLESIGDKKKDGEGAGDGGGPGGKMPDTKNVTDYKISGDKATAKAGAETLEFVKEDGRWFMKMPEKPKAD